LFWKGKMKKLIRVFVALALFSGIALGQATPISSGPDQAPAPAAAPQHKSTHAHRAKAHHAKAHHVSHKKHHRTA
jgi:hypothetical protein